ncbi:MAG: hypothetical protein KatS3mg112_1492 [Thermogutta sp.]|nr:MAG: hypothetical protein KatS3mg112_1492 [Thermogutta sp.]
MNHRGCQNSRVLVAGVCSEQPPSMGDEAVREGSHAPLSSFTRATEARFGTPLTDASMLSRRSPSLPCCARDCATKKFTRVILQTNQRKLNSLHMGLRPNFDQKIELFVGILPKTAACDKKRARRKKNLSRCRKLP